MGLSKVFRGVRDLGAGQVSLRGHSCTDACRRDRQFRPREQNKPRTRGLNTPQCLKHRLSRGTQPEKW